MFTKKFLIISNIVFLEIVPALVYIFRIIADSVRIKFKPATTIKQLAELTDNCIVCHSTYRVEAKKLSSI